MSLAQLQEMPISAAISKNTSSQISLHRNIRTVLLPLIAAAIVLGGWEAVVRLCHISEALLPAPSAIAVRLYDTLPFLLKHAVPTTVETLTSFVISSTIGVALAVLISASSFAREALYPNIVFFQLIPKIALAPVFIVWLGIGSSSRISFSVFIAFFPVVISTLTGLRAVDSDLLRLCRSVGASGFNIYTKVRFPVAMPFIFSGLKVAVTFAMIGVIVGEFITAQAGLGYMIFFAASQAEMSLIFASITVLCFIGLLLYGAVVLAEKIVLTKFGAR